MNESDKIKGLLRRVYREEDHASDAEGTESRILNAASTAFEQAWAGGQRTQRLPLWRCIMKNVKVRFGAVVAACAVALTVICLYDGSSRAWAVEDSKAIEESRALFNRGEHLFHNEKKYEEAIPIYQQVYEEYPDLNIASTALMMIGLCHNWLGEPEQEIAAYEKAVREYPYRYGWIESTYFYLGSAYEGQGQMDKALEAYDNCLIAGRGVRDPDTFPLKDARECIEYIKSR
jgi:tetratricopeptide (TPR) repeat protein